MRFILPALCCFFTLPSAVRGQDAMPATRQAARPAGIEDNSESPPTWNLDISDRRNGRITNSVLGATGLVHTSGAELGRGGIFRFSATGEYLHATNFPVPTAIETRSAATFGASFVPFSFFEIYGAYTASSNTNSSSMPVRLQSIGDATAGLKLSAHLARGLYSGVEGRVQFFSRVGGDAARTMGWGASPRFLLTYDAREQAPDVPFRIHFNFDFLWDTTRTLQNSQPLGAAEQFAFNANRFNRLGASLAMDFPLPLLTLFGEYGVTYPLGVPGNQLVGPAGNSVALLLALPQVATLGLKITAIQDLTLMAAIDLRVRSIVAQGIPTPAPYNFFFGASLNVDPFRAQTRIVRIVKQLPAAAPAPTTGRIAGTVTDAASQMPISGALILFAPSDLPPVASNPGSGKFLSYDLPQGPIKLKVLRMGYDDVERDVEIQPGQTLDIHLELKPSVKKTHLFVSVRSEHRPVAASVSITGTQNQEVSTTEGSVEPVAVEVQPGTYVINVSVSGYLAQTREVAIGDGGDLPVTFELVPEPKTRLVTRKDNKIETLQQIHFTPSKATLFPDSHSLLAQVVDLIVKSNIKRIRIVGHTDSSGSKSKNLRLSQERADAVAEYLEKAGIDKGRIETAGYGDTRPIVPNVTARGREINRRVEILILD